MAKTEQPSAAAIPWAIAIVAALVIAGIYLFAVGNALLSDDWGLFRHLGWAAVIDDFTRPWLDQSAIYYRPLATVSLTVDHVFFGAAPFGYHVTALLWWGAVATVAARVARRIANGDSLAGPVAFALCWLHPVAVEPVGWICCRSVLMAAFFALVGGLLADRFARRGGAGLLALVAVAHVVALLSKEDGLLTPVFTLVLAALVGFGRRWWSLVAVHAAVTVAYLGWRHAIGVPLEAGGHTALLAPSGWGDTARVFVSHATLAVAPRMESLGPALSVAAATVLLLIVARPPFVRIVAAVALVAGCLPSTLHAELDIVHGSRLLTFAAVGVAIGFGACIAAARRTRLLAIGLIAVPYLFVGLPVLDLWRVAGDETAAVARALHRLDAELPTGEGILFVDPPRHVGRVPALDQTPDAIVQPPFVTTPRPLISAFGALARRLAHDVDRPRMHHVEWRGGALQSAPLPSLAEELPSWLGTGSPPLGFSSLAITGLDVVLGVDREPTDFNVRIIGDRHTSMTVRSTVDRRGIHRLAFGDHLHAAGIVRIDRLVVTAGEREVSRVVLVRALPIVKLRGQLVRIGDAVELTLDTDPTWPVPTERISVRIHQLRALISRLDEPTTSFAPNEAGRRYQRRFPLSSLYEQGLRSGAELFVTITGHARDGAPALWESAPIAVRLP